QGLALFMLITTFAWNVKPLAGLLSDAIPLFGTRRRHYMMLGAGLSALCWAAMGVVPATYGPLLLAPFAVNTFMVIASTGMGGLLVEAGARYGVSGRVSAVRQALMSVVSLGNGVLGGYLAAVAFGWTVGLATGLLLTLTIASVAMLRERPVATRDIGVLRIA